MIETQDVEWNNNEYFLNDMLFNISFRIFTFSFLNLTSVFLLNGFWAKTFSMKHFFKNLRLIVETVLHYESNKIWCHSTKSENLDWTENTDTGKWSLYQSMLDALKAVIWTAFDSPRKNPVASQTCRFRVKPSGKGSTMWFSTLLHFANLWHGIITRVFKGILTLAVLNLLIKTIKICLHFLSFLQTKMCRRLIFRPPARQRHFHPGPSIPLQLTS